MGSKHAVHFTSAAQDWRTPASILDRVRKLGPIVLDPCASRSGLVNAHHELFGESAADDGLRADWMGLAKGGLIFVNPPYSAILSWTEKTSLEGRRGAHIVALLPARTDTKWFHTNVLASADAVVFIRGRIRFEGAPAVAPFPSALVVWGAASPRTIRDVFGESFGAVWQL